MAAMPRVRPPYLHRYHTRHGKFYWYVRKPGGRRIRIRAEFGTKDFDAEYRAALDGVSPPQQTRKASSGSLKWLWDRYRESSEWKAYSQATRDQRENIMLHVIAKSGELPFAGITKADMVASRDAKATTPAQARNQLDCFRGLFRWAVAAEHRDDDPTEGVKNPKKRKGKGFPPWTENDVAAYQARWPIGTKERVWLDVLLYTGPRRGDVVKLGRQHERLMLDPEAGKEVWVISFRTEKGGEQVEVTIPVLPVLRTTLDAGPTGELSYICGDRGHPLTKESFGNAFSDAARAAGVVKSAHGVRKIAATTCADNGATVHQLMAIFGWKTVQMAEHYTKEANRRRLALGGAHMLGRSSMCQPERKVGTLPLKNK